VEFVKSGKEKGRRRVTLFFLHATAETQKKARSEKDGGKGKINHIIHEEERKEKKKKKKLGTFF